MSNSKLAATFHGADEGFALRRFKRNLAALNHPFAEWLAMESPLAEETDAGFRMDVAELEAEGAALIGAEPCSEPHGYEIADPTFDGTTVPAPFIAFGSGCPGCKAAI